MTLSEKPTGIYYDIPFEEYIGFTAVNASSLKEFRKSPLHFQYARNFSRKASKSQVFGSLVHTLVLEPDLFFDRYAVIADLNLATTEGKTAKKKAQERHPTKTIIKDAERRSAETVAKNIKAHEKAYHFISRSKVEATIKWNTGDIECKGRVDAYAASLGLILDLKTSANIEDHAFSSAIFKYGYHIQMAWYQRGIRACGLPADVFAILAIENTAPYGVRLFEISQAAIDEANKDIDRWLERYRECQQSGIWPGYSQSITLIDIPKYAIALEDEA